MQAKCSSATLYEVLDRFGRQETEDSGFTGFTLIRIEGLDAEINDTALEGLLSKCQNLQKFETGYFDGAINEDKTLNEPAILSLLALGKTIVD